MRKRLLFLSACASLMLASPLSAQRFGDIVDPEFEDEINAAFAYLALIATPTGGLPDAVAPWMTGADRAGMGFRASFGYIDAGGGSFRNVGATFDIPFGRNDLGLTVGYLSPDCGDGVDCEGTVTFGADFSLPLMTRPAGQRSQFMLGLRAAGGYTKPDIGLEDDIGKVEDIDVSALSLALGAPLVLSVPTGGGNVRFVPFLTPSVGWGRVSISADAGGIDASVDFDKLRFMLSGGVGVSGLASGLILTASIKKVFVDEGDIMLGLGLSWNAVR